MDIDLDTQRNRSILFGILIAILFPSVTCSLYIFYNFFRLRDLRRQLNNHIVFCLLLMNFVQMTSELPMGLIVLHTGHVPVVGSISFCFVWQIYNYTLTAYGVMMLCHSCTERYFLIFHRNFFERHLIIFHYIPIISIIIYPIVLYTSLVAIYPCKASLDYTQVVCGPACYLNNHIFGSLDCFFDLCVPVLVGSIISVLIIVRILLQKRRMAQRSMWRRNRRMIIQLLSVASLYFIVWIPSVICYICSLFLSLPFLSALIDTDFIYWQYFPVLLYPFICAMSLPKVRNAFKLHFCQLLSMRIQRNTVRPIS